MDKYLEVLPEGAKVNILCLAPLPEKPAKPHKLWYRNTPMGQNHFNSMMKEMCKEDEFDTTFSNHSLRVYGATKVLQPKVPEKLIQQHTGHRSLEVLHHYEHTSLSQLVDVFLMLR